MHLPVIDGNDSRIDKATTSEIISYAIQHGINYFDTTWGYHSGNSESILEKALSQYPRDSFFLASKFPGYDLSTIDKAPAIFEEQLKKCGVEYFDFYLLHNVCEMNIEAYLDENYGIVAYLTKQVSKDCLEGNHEYFSVKRQSAYVCNGSSICRER